MGNKTMPFTEIMAMARGMERDRDPNKGMLPPPKIYRTGKEYGGRADKKNVEHEKRQARADMGRDDF